LLKPDEDDSLNTTTVTDNPVEEAKLLRKQAMGTPPGVERDRLLRKARQVEMVAKFANWGKTQPRGRE